ncbi:hypothetical protein ACLIA0_14010 [Bacillaceae bacterium W0354]
MLNDTMKDCSRKYTTYPSLFIGMAGVGNVLIDAYQFLEDDRYLNEAFKVARGIDIFKIERDKGIVFPGDQLAHVSTEFASGSAGIALFFNRLINPNTLNFNFLIDELPVDSNEIVKQNAIQL